MRIFDVTGRSASPIAAGGMVRIHNLLRHLSRQHEVRQLCFGPLTRPYRKALKETPITPTYRVVTYVTPVGATAARLSHSVWDSRSMAARAAIRYMRTSRLERLASWADVLLFEGPWLIEMRRRWAGHVVVGMHNVETARFGSYMEAKGHSKGARRRLGQIERIQAEAIAAASLLTAVSEDDRHEFVERYGADPARTIVVPNGADTERYRPVDPDTKASFKRELGLPDRPTVLYLGSRFPPNTVGLSWVRRAAKATDRFTFLVVGAVSRPGVHGNVVATGVVPDIAPYLHASDFAICPVQYGAGTKIKLFESLAAGLPSVVFRESLHGTSFLDGEHVLVSAKGEAELVASLERLAGDVALAEHIRAQGRAHVVEHHDWALSAAVLNAALRELVGDQERRLTYRAPIRSGESAAR